MNQLLYPADTGGKIRSSKLFEHLSKEHDITVVVLLRDTETAAQAEAMRACCSRLELVSWRETAKFTPRFYLELLTNLVSRHPYIVQKYTRPALRRRVAELLAEETYDVLLGEFRRLADGISAEEMARAQIGLKSSVILQSESSSSRASSIGSDHYMLGRVRSLDEIKQKIEETSVESVLGFLRSRPFEDFTVVTVGPRAINV